MDGYQRQPVIVKWLQLLVGGAVPADPGTAALVHDRIKCSNQSAGGRSPTAVPSGPSTRSTGSWFATTTKEAESSCHSLLAGSWNVVPPTAVVLDLIRTLQFGGQRAPAGDKTTGDEQSESAFTLPEVWPRRHDV